MINRPVKVFIVSCLFIFSVSVNISNKGFSTMGSQGHESRVECYQCLTLINDRETEAVSRGNQSATVPWH